MFVSLPSCSFPWPPSGPHADGRIPGPRRELPIELTTGCGPGGAGAHAAFQSTFLAMALQLRCESQGPPSCCCASTAILMSPRSSSQVGNIMAGTATSLVPPNEGKSVSLYTFDTCALGCKWWWRSFFLLQWSSFNNSVDVLPGLVHTKSCTA